MWFTASVRIFLLVTIDCTILVTRLLALLYTTYNIIRGVGALCLLTET